jgi:hypothetical protein
MNYHHHLNILNKPQVIQIIHIIFILLSLSFYCHAFQQILVLSPSSVSSKLLPSSHPSYSHQHTNLFATSYNPNPNSSPSSSSSYNSKTNKNGILSPTARESAVIVEWEPVSELQRRIEDGIHYEHYEYDPLYDYGSEEKKQMRKEFCRRGKRRNGDDIGNDDGGDVGNNHGDDDNGIDYGIGVFCGFTVSKEEMERLKSAHP